jgi:small subunit ribosomal protein S8
MSATDPIAAMLTQIRNANERGISEVVLPHSQLKANVARVLKKEGYLQDFKVQKEDGKTNLLLALKGKGDSRAISTLKRVSTPGRRKYVGVREIPRVLGGMGICIISTSVGVMTGQEAKKKNVGGELLCHVW